jgi:probable HAF family extracellular repeat protein
METKRQHKRHFVTIALLSLIGLMPATAGAAGEYEIVDLGTLGGSFSGANGINDSDQVVGRSDTASGHVHAFLWTATSGMQDLGTVGTHSAAYGINDSGQVVGQSPTAAGQTHAVLWRPATPETILADLALFIEEQVDSGRIDIELENSLLAKIGAALSAIDRGNPNDAKVAMNDLKALINQVEAQTGKKIAPDTAAEIIKRANDIIVTLGS